MAVKVKDLLKLPIYKKNVVLLADEGLDNLIENLTVMEAPDFHYSSLSKNVLILSTLSSRHDSIETINSTIEELCKENVSAIMIKLGRFINEIDESTIKIAKSYKVPLLVLNSTTYFTDILSESFISISGDRAATIVTINNISNDIMSAIMNRKSDKDILKIIDNELNCHTYLYDSSDKLISNFSKEEKEVESSRFLIDKLIDIRTRNKDHQFQQQDNMIAFVCENNYDIVGYGCLVFDDVILKPNVLFIQSISRLLSIKLAQNSIEENVKKRLVSSLMDDILFNEHKDESLIVDRLKTLNFKPLNKHLLLIIEVEENHHMNSIFSTIQKTFSMKVSSSFVFLQENTFIVLLSFSKNVSVNDVKSIINDCALIINGQVNIKMKYACSSVINDLRNMPNCHKQAKMAMRFGQKQSADNSVYFYDDFIEIGLISHSLDSKTSDIFFERIINPLKKYDELYNADLWRTLESCYSSASLNDAADKLQIHISTLRYRLSKIDILTGYNYIDNNNRMTLYLAYMLYRASQN